MSGECRQLGEDSLYFQAPFGYTFQLVPETDQSVSVYLTKPDGTSKRVWNDIAWGTCSIFGTGVGISVTTSTANPILGAFAAAMATYACNQTAKNHSDEDGDAYPTPLC